jgi:hypothetical protein
MEQLVPYVQRVEAFGEVAQREHGQPPAAQVRTLEREATRVRDAR